MGKVLQFPNRREGGIGGSDTVQNARPAPESLDTFLDLNHFTNLVRFMTKLMKTGPEAHDKENIRRRQENMRDARPEELYTWANRSNENDWRIHPSFYHALIREVKRGGTSLTRLSLQFVIFFERFRGEIRAAPVISSVGIVVVSEQ